MKKMKVYNVLILDDVKEIGDCISDRMKCVNSFYSSRFGIRIEPHYIRVDIKNPVIAEEIAQCINTNKIDYLLLDRGFSPILNSEEEKLQNLDSEHLWAEKKSVWIEAILQKIPQETYNQIKGIIIYTYDPRKGTVESLPSFIIDKCVSVLPKKFNEDNIIDVFSSYPEIYEVAELKLKPYPYDDSINYRDMGKKPDLKLYGLFMGEILYHRVISMINQREKKRLIEKKHFYIKNILILFFVFTGLSIGGNALYNMLVQSTGFNLLSLLVISAVFSLFLPIFLLLTKPKSLISIDNED